VRASIERAARGSVATLTCSSPEPVSTRTA
jgi:hypothetical protein